MHHHHYYRPVAVRHGWAGLIVKDLEINRDRGVGRGRADHCEVQGDAGAEPAGDVLGSMQTVRVLGPEPV